MLLEICYYIAIALMALGAILGVVFIFMVVPAAYFMIKDEVDDRPGLRRHNEWVGRHRQNRDVMDDDFFKIMVEEFKDTPFGSLTKLVSSDV